MTKPIQPKSPKKKFSKGTLSLSKDEKSSNKTKTERKPTKQFTKKAQTRPSSRTGSDIMENVNSTAQPGIRLNKRMSELGLSSRREADDLILKGLVYVDDVKAEHPSLRVNASQKITINQEDAQYKLHKKMKNTIILNKPVGYVSGTPEEGYTTALTLIKKENQHINPDQINQGFSTRGLAPCGRLDINSEGLIIYSSDGVIAKNIIAPDSNLDKEYLIRFIGECSNEQIEQLRYGIVLDDKQLKPAVVKKINDNQLKIMLKEGRKRQIRRMCDIVGLEITKLMRVRVGPIKLSSLPLGKWRILTEEEVNSILNYK